MGTTNNMLIRQAANTESADNEHGLYLTASSFTVNHCTIFDLYSLESHQGLETRTVGPIIVVGQEALPPRAIRG